MIKLVKIPKNPISNDNYVPIIDHVKNDKFRNIEIVGIDDERGAKDVKNAIINLTRTRIREIGLG